MLSTRIFGLACAVAVFVCLLAAPVSAQPLDKRTLFTFSAPITLPGVTLPAGQYLFRLAAPGSSSNVVQVLNADGTKPYGMFFTLPAERFEGRQRLVVKGGKGGFAGRGQNVFDGTVPERAAEDGGVLEDGSLGGAERIEPRLE